MVDRTQWSRSEIFRVRREQVADTNSDRWGSLREDVETSASTRVQDLSTTQCLDAFDVLYAAMKASGQPDPLPTNAQMESFLKLVVGHDKLLLQREMSSESGGQVFFNPQVKTLVGVSKDTQEPVYGHLHFFGNSEMRYSLHVHGKDVHSQNLWSGERLAKISPNDVQFTDKNPTWWMSQLIEEARLNVFKHVCNSNLFIAIQTARWCINVRLMCKEPHVPALKHYHSLAGVEARSFVQLSEFLSDYPYLAIICVEKPRTVFDELHPDSEMLADMMQKLQHKTEEAEPAVPSNGPSFDCGLESIAEEAEEAEEEDSGGWGQYPPKEEEVGYQDGRYDYEDEGFDYADEGFDYEEDGFDPPRAAW
ncbi:unnamed protein product [Clonostachys rosea]|uniref:HNH nuclease domain-containing protein n=1 Tax=Bionectria ochroleuca TaxID=29856 RepID=A0ABY6U3U9_BIOOC|nr:unnamed protein product [Clonostachys rosea]